MNKNHIVLLSSVFATLLITSVHARDNQYAKEQEQALASYEQFQNEQTLGQLAIDQDLDIDTDSNDEDSDGQLLSTPNAIEYPLHYIAATGDLEVFEQIIENAPNETFADLDDHNLTPMHYAAYFGYTDVVQRLHQVNPQLITMHGGPLNASPLAYAIHTYQLNTIDTLLTLGADPYERISDMGNPLVGPLNSLLSIRADTPSTQIAELFIAHGYQFRNDDNTLHNAALHHNHELIAYLIQHGARIDQRDHAGNLPIHYVLYYNQTNNTELASDEEILRLQETIDILAATLNEPVNESARDSILHLAAQTNNVQAAAYVLQLNPELVHARTPSGISPLHFAAIGNNVEMIAFLIDQLHMSVDETNNQGITALHFAANNSAQEAIRALITRGAAIDIHDHEGTTPYDTAVAYDALNHIDPNAPNSITALMLDTYYAHHQNGILPAAFQLAFDTLKRSNSLFWLPIALTMHRKLQYNLL